MTPTFVLPRRTTIMLTNYIVIQLDEGRRMKRWIRIGTFVIVAWIGLLSDLQYFYIWNVICCTLQLGQLVSFIFVKARRQLQPISDHR